jgi:hypothetical protein
VFASSAAAFLFIPSGAQRSRGISNFFCVATFELTAIPQQRETSLDMTATEQEIKKAANSCGWGQALLSSVFP